MTRESIEDLIDKGLAAQDAYFNSGAFRHTAEGGMLAVLNAVLPKEAEMVSKAEYTDGYRAAVELGDPLAPRTLHAVLEAAEVTRRVSRDAEIQRLRGVLREVRFQALNAAAVIANEPERDPDAEIVEWIDDALHSGKEKA